MHEDVLRPQSAEDGEVAAVDLGAELLPRQAEQEIDEAVRGRRRIARRYVRRLRRRHPDATPAEILSLLERHYVTAISVTGAAVTAGALAVEIGFGLIPGAGAAKTGGKAAAKAATKGTMKATGKKVATGLAKSGSARAVALLPAGDAQLQFEITALFALAVADIHVKKFDQHQAHALVYGLSNRRMSQKQIAAMAAGLATESDSGQVKPGRQQDEPRDWSRWAETLADSLPGDQAQKLVRGVATGVLEDVRTGLQQKEQERVEYGVGALVGGATRFVFGRQVVEAARSAFPDPPSGFPHYLSVPKKAEKAEDESDRALSALEDAAKVVGTTVVSGATAVATAADAVSRPFRRVDRDGDGVPDEPQVLGAARSAVSAAGVVSRPFRKVDLDGDGVPDEPRALTAAKGLGTALASSLRGRGSDPTAHEPAQGDDAPSSA